ncbi:MAG: hypothetical protein OXN89_02165 [Bryobacterales bacterium]|nr:hypothetical protein [Bryobacterales bacterium]
MPIDFDAVREAYFGPPLASPPDHLPTTEELLAERERIRMRCTLDLGLDPVAEGVGEHGSLIGGLGKPLTIVGRPAGRLLRVEPMPLEWFDYPQARQAWHGPVKDEAEFLAGLICRHLAGFAGRPTPPELAVWLRSSDQSRRKRAALYNIFETIRPSERPQLLSKAHLSVYEVARAVHLSGSRAPGTVRWLHQFALEPPTGPARRVR